MMGPEMGSGAVCSMQSHVRRKMCFMKDSGSRASKLVTLVFFVRCYLPVANRLNLCT